MSNNRRTPLSGSPLNRRWVVQGYMVLRTNTQFTPPTDVIELEDRMLVLIELAGMRSEDFSVTLQDRRLVISGLRESPSLREPAYHQVEINYGEFRVDVALPWAVEPDSIQANYRDGFLSVELPRKPERQIHVVAVQNEDAKRNE